MKWFPKSQRQQEDGERVVKWFKSVFEKGSTASAFLGGVLLTITTSGSEKHIEPIRRTAAAGATLFLVLFLLCVGLPLLFEFHGEGLEIELNKPTKGWVHALLAALSFLLQGLALSGATCVFLIMVPFVPAAGWAGFGVTMGLALVALACWALQITGREVKLFQRSGTHPQVPGRR
ncbi:hypothetical protein LTR15_005257 [Elasticomyces elasticus]|nr:hypothetical protein LTR15_005257 [Elasticomyces elasticus]